MKMFDSRRVKKPFPRPASSPHDRIEQLLRPRIGTGLRVVEVAQREIDRTVVEVELAVAIDDLLNLRQVDLYATRRDRLLDRSLDTDSSPHPSVHSNKTTTGSRPPVTGCATRRSKATTSLTVST